LICSIELISLIFEPLHFFTVDKVKQNRHTQSQAYQLLLEVRSMDLERKRKRGRPRGSGKDDSAALDRIANLLVADQSLKHTTAIKRIGFRNPADIRRLQVKWKDGREDLLADARKRSEARHAKRRSGDYRLPADLVEIATQADELRRQLATLIDPDLVRFAAQAEQLRRALVPSHIEDAQRAINEGLRPALDAFEKQRQMMRQLLRPIEDLRHMQELFGLAPKATST
jgi:hypothetical protein